MQAEGGRAYQGSCRQAGIWSETGRIYPLQICMLIQHAAFHWSLKSIPITVHWCLRVTRNRSIKSQWNACLIPFIRTKLFGRKRWKMGKNALLIALHFILRHCNLPLTITTTLRVCGMNGTSSRECNSAEEAVSWWWSRTCARGGTQMWLSAHRALPARSCGHQMWCKLICCVILRLVFKIWLLGSDKPTTLSAKESRYLSRLIGLESQDL